MATTIASSTSRDLRIDLLRGFALVIVILDHIRGNPIRQFTPGRFGFSDMAELFFFLSGFVCGIAYSRRLAMRGFRDCQAKACRRAIQLYAANLLMLAIFILCVQTWYVWLPEFPRLPESYQLNALTNSSGSFVLRILLLEFEPIVFAVLPFYIVMLCLLPGLLFIARRSLLTVGLMSIGLYVAVQLFPAHVVLSDPWRSAWYFNPFAWQVVFIGGALSSQMSGSFRKSLSQGRTLPILAAVGLEAAFIATTYYGSDGVPFAAKVNLEPLRLVHFGCMLILAARFLPSRENPLWNSMWFSPIVTCGQNSLATYCMGGLLSTAGTLVFLAFGSSGITAAVVNGLACLGMFAFASAWSAIKVRRAGRLQPQSRLGSAHAS